MSEGVVETRLREAGLELPSVPTPVAQYVPAKVVGDFVYVSGQGPISHGTATHVGRVGREVSQQEAYEAARTCILNALAAVNSITGSLDRISEIVHVRAFVNSDPDFHEQPAVANGASDLLVDLFGEKGRHTRAALGTSNLPGNIPVEIELLVRVDPLS